MANRNYYDLNSAQEVLDLVKKVCTVGEEKVLSVDDKEKLCNEVIYTLQFNASVSENQEVRNASIFWINKIAENFKIVSSSNYEFYAEKSEGKHQFFTVPAINARMVTFHMVRAAVRTADNLKVPHVIFELAKTEGVYTGQEKDLYAALVKAGYISLGLENRTIYIQADHYQVDPDKYRENPEAEMNVLKKAIVKAIENGVYNIDIDSSKFETDDPNKSDRENQSENARLTAEILAFIRQYESEQNLPCVISVGGEVGEVGGENTKYPQVNAYLELIKENLDKLDATNIKGLDKVSINVGSSHGGVLGPDGQPLDSVPLDFQAHHDLYMMGKDPLKPGKHILPVQHGASTLPKKYFSLFPAMHVAEVHLATGFQNLIWDVLEREDQKLFNKMRDLVFEKFADKLKKYDTEAIGFSKERKRVTEFIKRDLLLTPALEKIEAELETEFMTLFNLLFTILQSKTAVVEKGDRND